MKTITLNFSLGTNCYPELKAWFSWAAVSIWVNCEHFYFDKKTTAYTLNFQEFFFFFSPFLLVQLSWFGITEDIE